MRLILTLATTIAIAALFTTPAMAGGSCSDGASMAGRIFDDADQDADGNLSVDEFDRAGFGRFGSTFEDMDANEDGIMTRAEYLEFYDRIHKSGKELTA